MQAWIPFPIDSIESSQVLSLQGMVWMLSIVLILFGNRFYRLSLFAPGFVLGALISEDFLYAQPPVIRLGGVLLIGVLGAGIVMVLERLAIALLGALMGMVVYQSYVSINGPPDELEMQWLMPAVVSLLGSVVVPVLFDRYLLVATSLAGTLGLAWSTNHMDQSFIPYLAGVWAGGCCVQYWLQPSKSDSKIK
ncbi:MAG: hypothetical protein CMK59_10800 [Proteobacteria bacterium]|nr:hypothetical protein [Pseudomonadota bacterium]